VTSAKLADDAVITSKLRNDSVTGEKIGSGQVVKSLNGKTDDITLVEGSNITIAPSGNTLTISATGSAGCGWSLTGNVGTSPGINFLGTTDNQPLELRVNGARSLRLQPDVTSPSLIGGYSGNSVTSGVYGGTIGGGGYSGYENRVTDVYGTIGGGVGNRAGDDSGTTSDITSATVGGGTSNTASGNYSTVSGGRSNTANNMYSTVGGGYSNVASDHFSTIAGGNINIADGNISTVGGGGGNNASGGYSTVPGGKNNTAGGDYSFAAGRKAKVAADHDGAFLFADSHDLDFNSAAVDEFAVRCTGGARFVAEIDGSGNPTVWTELDTTTGEWIPTPGSPSDRNLKTNFAPVAGRDVLQVLASIPIETWNYKNQDPSIRHIGPMAQDFRSAFGFGRDDKRIEYVDAYGVALAAIQGLYEVVKEKDAENATLRQQVDDLEARLAALEALVSPNTREE